MNIYLIPKNYNTPEIKINENVNQTKVCQSLMNFVNERDDTEIEDLKENLSFEDEIKDILKIKKENKYLLSFVEIVNYFNLLKEENEKYLINFFVDDFADFMDFNKYFRSNKNDIIVSKDPLINDFLKLPFINENQFDLLVFEIKENKNILQVLKIIVLNIQVNGDVIIKCNETTSHIFLEFLYILSFIFQKVLIVKPSISNIVSMEKYLLCSNSEINSNIKQNIEKEYEKNEKEIFSILSKNVPIYFQNKVEDINVIFGQQYLESCDHCMNINKSKNKEEKRENMKKTNIQKANQWIEKNKINI
jgi:hypothetical protein